ncbi:MAG: CCCH zinc finger protein [Chloroflexota bacterium]
MAQCKARTTNKQPCKMQALKGKRYCYNHAPEAGVARALSRKKGGENRHTPHFADAGTLPAQVRTLEDASSILSYTLAEILGHDNTIARARVLLALYDSFVKSFEIGEMEKRIQALETRT